MIGLKDSRQLFNHWESKTKPIATCTRGFAHASSELQVIARNYCDCFIALSAPGVIGRSNCFGFGFSTAIWKPLYVTSNVSFNINCLLFLENPQNAGVDIDQRRSYPSFCHKGQLRVTGSNYHSILVSFCITPGSMLLLSIKTLGRERWHGVKFPVQTNGAMTDEFIDL